MIMKVLLDMQYKIEGVELQYGDVIREKIEAKEEVILCAGAISTPHLLMLSGIGPADLLQKYKV
jgi:choline dehydrogenase